MTAKEFSEEIKRDQTALVELDINELGETAAEGTTTYFRSREWIKEDGVWKVIL